MGQEEQKKVDGAPCASCAQLLDRRATESPILHARLTYFLSELMAAMYSSPFFALSRKKFNNIL